MDSRGGWQFIMDWKKKISGLRGRMTKGNWIILLCAGLILMILAAPAGGEKSGENRVSGSPAQEKDGDSYNGNLQKNSAGQAGAAAQGNTSDFWSGILDGEEENDSSGAAGDSNTNSEGIFFAAAYEQQLEARVKEVLSQVEGVGQVDVMILLKSSGQKIYQTDDKNSLSSTKEQDSSGGTRDIEEQQIESSTVIVGSGQEEALLETELYPEVSGIVISAQGGGTPAVQNEITEAMEALFGLPAHKIKVLKRNEN